MRPDTLGLIGLDALGASIAWSAVRAGVPRVIAYTDRRRAAVRAAKLGAVTEIAHETGAVTREADLVVITGQPTKAVRVLHAIGSAARERGVFVTDLAVPKRAMHAAAARLELNELFAGSSPTVLPPTTDVGAAHPELLLEQIVYVTPVLQATRAAAEVADFWQRVVGARPVTMDSERHDAVMAWTAHLPQAAAFALAAALADAAPDGVTHRVGTLDQTRAAAGDPTALGEVLLENRDHVLDALAALEGRVDALRDAIERGDPRALARVLERGGAWRRRFDR
jgi:prephenate dehydrogenase